MRYICLYSVVSQHQLSLLDIFAHFYGRRFSQMTWNFELSTLAI